MDQAQACLCPTTCRLLPRRFIQPWPEPALSWRTGIASTGRKEPGSQLQCAIWLALAEMLIDRAAGGLIAC
jgi:hypothetical protein